MSWLRKKRGPRTGYYYQSKKVKGRVIKVYLGRGPLAVLAAQMDKRKQQVRKVEQLAWLNERSRIAAADQAVREARSLAELLVSSVLILDGYHRHHGEWRRRHGYKKHGN